MIDPALAEAYRRTAYLIDAGPARFEIRHGRHHPGWDAFISREAPGLTDWAMITAWNPRSERPADEAQNREAHARLERALRAAGARVFSGEGRGDDGTWPAEPTWTAVGLSREEALRLGRDFGQHAIVVGHVGGPARIVLCEDGSELP